MSGITLDGIAIKEYLKCDKRAKPLSGNDKYFMAWIETALAPISKDEVNYYKEYNQKIAGYTFDEYVNLIKQHKGVCYD